MSRPGLILYFGDWRAVARRLDMAQRGELVSSLMAFAETGELQEISDPMTAFAFDVFSEKVSRDAENYRVRCIKSAFSTYCRECKKRGETALPFEEWLKHRSISTDSERWETETESEPEQELESEMECETETEFEQETEGEKGAGGGTRGRTGGNQPAATSPLTPEEKDRRKYAMIDALLSGRS